MPRAIVQGPAAEVCELFRLAGEPTPLTAIDRSLGIEPGGFDLDSPAEVDAEMALYPAEWSPPADWMSGLVGYTGEGQP